MAFKGNKVFNTNSVTNKMLQESTLSPAIEAGDLVVFHAEENTSTNKSTNVYFIQKVADATSTDGLDMGIIANTSGRGNNSKYVRSVRSFTNTINNKNQDVIIDFAKQTVALQLAGEAPFSIDLKKFAIEQVRTVGLQLANVIGASPVRNPNEGVLAVDGTPIFETTTVKSKADGKPVVSTLKHTDYITEEQLGMYLDSIGVDDFTKERMMRNGNSGSVSHISELGTASAIGGNF